MPQLAKMKFTYSFKSIVQNTLPTIFNDPCLIIMVLTRLAIYYMLIPLHPKLKLQVLRWM